MTRWVIPILALSVLGSGRPAWGQDAVPSPLYGVTVDKVSDLPEIVESLAKLCHKPTTRIVFGRGVPASRYVEAAKEIHKVSYVMGEIVDSFFMDKYGVEEYLTRTSEYLKVLSDHVDIWEIGNEINGDWCGPTPAVAAKMIGAYDRVKAAGKTTELTLYYNQGCAKHPENEMFAWAEANIPERMKQGLDYVLVSYYEDDCKMLQPDWPSVFQRLAVMFPNSKLGMGECGSKYKSRKAAYIKRYYTMKINEPRYVGGYFWWYYKQDMVPYTKPLWGLLNSVWSGSSPAGPAEPSSPGAVPRQ
jgi:hypothetical protein